jgi:hypothetical protein
MRLRRLLTSRSASRWALAAGLLGACLNPQPDSQPTFAGESVTGPGDGSSVIDVQPETCSDNALLAGCSTASPGASPGAGAGGSASAGGGAGSGGSEMGPGESPPDAGPPDGGGGDADAP